MAAVLEKLFGLQKSGTSVRQEALGGFTTFLAMSYLVFVVPSMLADAGMDRQAAVAATIFVTVVASLVMGLWANLPIAVGPGLGVSAYFAYYVCGPAGFTWQAALAAVFISGVVFFVLTVSRVRELIIDAIPPDLKVATTVGIGCFIALIGMKNCGLIVNAPDMGLALGNVKSPEVLIAVTGFFATAFLMVHRVSAAVIIGILFTGLLSFVFGTAKAPESWIALEAPDITKNFLVLDFAGALSHGLATIVFTLTVVDLFDNIGSLIGLSRKAGYIEPDGSIRNLGRAFMTDSFGTMFSGIMGTSTAVQYLESATGIAAGARTGLSTVFVALFFAATFVFIPLVSAVPTSATAPALVIVGVLMMQEVRHIHFENLRIAIASFLMIVAMPWTFNIATGFGFGFIAYVLLTLAVGRWREISFVSYCICAAFALNFALR